MDFELPKRVLVTPRPEEQESIPGYLLRVAEANGYPKFQWLARAAGLRRIDPFGGSGNLQLEALLNLEPGEIDGKFYGRTAVEGARDHVRFGNGTVHRFAIDLKRARICPLCLAEKGIARMAWDLAAVTVCPHHQCRLIDECPTCKSPLTWSRDKLATCLHGHDLTQVEVMPASDPACGLGAVILEKAGLSNAAESNVEFAPAVERMKIADALDLTTFLGTWAIGRGGGQGRRVIRNLPLQDRHAAFGAAAGILSEWPNRFYALLDNIRSNSEETQSRTGLEKEFGSLYTTLYSVSGGPPFARFLKGPFETYVKKYWSGGYLTRKNSRFEHSGTDESRYAPIAGCTHRSSEASSTLDTSQLCIV